jgi:hypothetical protein
MKSTQNLLRILTGIALAFVASGVFAADAPAGPASGDASLGGLPQLLGALKDIPIPSLNGLIQPEKMGVLTDNTCRVSDNQPRLMSDNTAERDFQSGNSLEVLSNYRLLSDITVSVEVHVHQGDAQAAQHKDRDKARKTEKKKKDKARAKKAKADKAQAEKAAQAKRKT